MLKASEGQRFNRKWRKERDADHIIVKNEKTAGEATGHTPPIMLTTVLGWWGGAQLLLVELVPLLVFFLVPSIPQFFFLCFFYKVIFCCVVNWIPGAFPDCVVPSLVLGLQLNSFFCQFGTED